MIGLVHSTSNKLKHNTHMHAHTHACVYVCVMNWNDNRAYFFFHFSEETFYEILLRLSSHVDNSLRKNLINVDRDDVLDGGFRGLHRSHFESRALLNVRFAGEPGIDTGGLTREFMRLAMNAIKSLPIFHGADNAKHIALDYKGNKTSTVIFPASHLIHVLPLALS